MDERITNIIDALEELTEDNTVPRNVKCKISDIIAILKGDGEDLSIKVNKVLSELDDISDDMNIQPYTRTQIWNIASMLEMIV